MTIVLNIALALSVISFALSAATFTPMVFASVPAALIALLGIRQGHFRRGLLTVFFAAGAAIVSPIVFNGQPVERWLVALSVIGATSAAVMYWTYRRHRNRFH